MLDVVEEVFRVLEDLVVVDVAHENEEQVVLALVAGRFFPRFSNLVHLLDLFAEVLENDGGLAAEVVGLLDVAAVGFLRKSQ